MYGKSIRKYSMIPRMQITKDEINLDFGLCLPHVLNGDVHSGYV